MTLVVIVQAGQILLVAAYPSTQVDLDRVAATGLSFSKVDILKVMVLGQLFTGILRSLCQPFIDVAVLAIIARPIAAGAYGHQLSNVLVTGVVDAAGIVAIVAIFNAQRDLKIISARASGFADVAHVEALLLSVALTGALAGGVAVVRVLRGPGQYLLEKILRVELCLGHASGRQKNAAR